MGGGDVGRSNNLPALGWFAWTFLAQSLALAPHQEGLVDPGTVLADATLVRHHLFRLGFLIPGSLRRHGFMVTELNR